MHPSPSLCRPQLIALCSILWLPLSAFAVKGRTGSCSLLVLQMWLWTRPLPPGDLPCPGVRRVPLSTDAACISCGENAPQHLPNVREYKGVDDTR